MKMSKSSIPILAKGLAEKSAIGQNDAETFIKAMFDVANVALQDSKLLKVKWLGTFKVTSIKERESVDVNTGDRILIEGREKIAFTPDNVLKEIVNKPFAQFETVVVNDGVDFSAVDEKFSKLEEQDDSIASESSESELNTPQKFVSRDIPEDSADAVEEVVVEQAELTAAPAETLDRPIREEVVREEEKEAESNEVVEQLPSEKVAVEQTPQEKPLLNESLEEETVVDRHHIVLSKRLVVAVSIVFVILVGGMCWFAFNYGKLAAQRDHLALQLTNIQQKKTQQSRVQSKPQQVTIDKEQENLRQKAMEDSVRLSKAHEAVKMAEQKEQEASKQQVEEKKQTETSQFETDPRIRTGAYRIVGVAQTITVKNGETLSSLSKRYLGPGMECYLEAINDAKQVKVGQKIKIPKLELKKKSK